MKACFQIAECSFYFAKIELNSKKNKFFWEILWNYLHVSIVNSIFAFINE